ncbi:MAG: ABC transporter substrate-binding protein [Desulfobacterales bacterium]|nr:ABC transporter substrate-binding protein [Desulfobacterales bacterium]
MKMKRWQGYLLIGLIVAAVIFRISQTRYLNDDGRIHIAFCGPMSGEGGEAGKFMTQAIQLYLDQVNQEGGVNGKDVVLDVFDDRNSAETSEKNAREMAEQNRALAVIGHWYSSCSIAAGKVYQQHGIPAVTPGAMRLEVTRDNEWYFRTIYTMKTPGVFLPHYIKKVMNRDRVSIIHEDANYSHLADIFVETAPEVDLEVKYTWEFKVQDPNLDQRLQAIVDELKTKEDAGVIVMPVQAPEGVRLVKMLRDAGIENTLLGPSSFYEETFLRGFQKLPKERESPGFYTNGIYVETPLIFDTANEEAQQLKHALLEKYGEEDPDWSVAFAHDSVKVIIEAMKKNGVVGGPETLAADRTRIKEHLAGLDSPRKAMEGAAGLTYFDEYGDSQRPVSIGVYKNNKIISAFTQLRIVKNIKEIHDAEEALSKGRILAIDDGYMKKAQVIYTGLKIEKISELDRQALTCQLKGHLWFRFQGEMDVANVQFLNAVEPVELTLVRERPGETPDPDPGEASGANKIGVKPNYRLYSFNGKFKVDYHRPQRPFGVHNLGFSFRHRTLTADSAIYVTDELGMGLKSAESLLERLKREQVFSSVQGWALDNIRFYQDTMAADSLGDTAHLNGSKGGLAYSRFNFDITITRESLTIRRITPHKLAKYAALFLIVAILLVTVGAKWKRLEHYVRVLWCIQAILWGGLLMVGETSVLHGLIGAIPTYHLKNVLKLFDVLWWVIPAHFTVRAIELFLWIPLESRTERTIPSIVRRMVNFFVYLLAFFGIIAFTFNYALTGLLATSGLLAMIIGLAVQMNISNVFSGIALSVERPFRIGDWVKIGADEGKVVNMTWRTTRIETSFENVVSIPNSTASEAIVENMYYPEQKYWKGFTVHVDPIHPPARVVKLLNDAVLSLKDVIDPWVMFAGMTDWSASYWVYFSARDYGQRWGHFEQIWEKTWLQLNNAGVEFAIKDRERHNFRIKDAGKEEGLTILENTAVFDTLAMDVKSALGRMMHRIQIPPDGLVLREGMPGTSFYIIAEGVVGIWTTLKSGKNIEVTRRGAGEIVGETPLLTGQKRDATVKAITDVVLYEIKKPDITPLLENQPEFLHRLRGMRAERTVERKVVRDEHISKEVDAKPSHGFIYNKFQQLFGAKKNNGATSGATLSPDEPDPEKGKS